jgi:hypothetical protein
MKHSPTLSELLCSDSALIDLTSSKLDPIEVIVCLAANSFAVNIDLDCSFAYSFDT